MPNIHSFIHHLFYTFPLSSDCDKVLKTFDENFCKNSFKKHLGMSFVCAKVVFFSVVLVVYH